MLDRSDPYFAAALSLTIEHWLFRHEATPTQVNNRRLRFYLGRRARDGRHFTHHHDHDRTHLPRIASQCSPAHTSVHPPPIPPPPPTNPTPASSQVMHLHGALSVFRHAVAA